MPGRPDPASFPPPPLPERLTPAALQAALPFGDVTVAASGHGTVAAFR